MRLPPYIKIPIGKLVFCAMLPGPCTVKGESMQIPHPLGHSLWVKHLEILTLARPLLEVG